MNAKVPVLTMLPSVRPCRSWRKANYFNVRAVACARQYRIEPHSGYPRGSQNDFDPALCANCHCTLAGTQRTESVPAVEASVHVRLLSAELKAGTTTAQQKEPERTGPATESNWYLIGHEINRGSAAVLHDEKVSRRREVYQPTVGINEVFVVLSESQQQRAIRRIAGLQTA